MLVVVGGRRSGGEGGAGRLQEAAEELWMKVEEHSVERRIIEDERRWRGEGVGGFVRKGRSDGVEEIHLERDRISSIEVKFHQS